MNQYLLLRRLRGPVILVTVGVMALLDQYGSLSFSQSWPLILIVIGILQLGERMALSQMPPPPPPGGFYPDMYGAPMPPAGSAQSATQQASGEYTAQSQPERKY